MNRDLRLQHPLVQRLHDARDVTDALFAVVKPEHLYERPIRERHRIVFYIGHLEAFDHNLFDGRLFPLPVFDAELDKLFAFGIDPVDGGFPTDQPADWPSLDIVRNYAQHARAQIDRAIATFDFDSDDVSTNSPAQLMQVAIEHRLMHAETLAYMLHQLPLEQKVAPAPSTAAPASNVAPGNVAHATTMVRVPAGRVTLGMPRESGQFGWDNEFGEQQVDVDAFEIDRYMVTNGEFLQFVDAGGYRNRAYWNDKDWAWKEAEHIEQPVGWTRRDGGWTLRTMFDEVALPLDWPAYVSHAEASAYARWAGKVLPTEAQWQRAAQGTPQPDTLPGNFDFRSWDPQPVNAHPGNVSTFGAEGMFGNGWEWTTSLFEPLPGFEAFPFYLGYSANFFDGQHYVIKGGSARTAQCMLRPTFRNWFQPRYQYVFAGFRCVRN
jgi:iron(II)-dependent oxidoreductase